MKLSKAIEQLTKILTEEGDKDLVVVYPDTERRIYFGIPKFMNNEDDDEVVICEDTED